MTRSNRAATILGATALLALSLTAPAAATETRSLSPALTSEVSSAGIPVPRARPAYLRKRIGAWPIVRPTSQQIASIWAPYRRVVVAHWPVLMLGIGF